MKTIQNYRFENYLFKKSAITFSKSEIDKFGNRLLPIKIKGLLSPYAIIKIKDNCIWPTRNKNFYKIGLNLDKVYWISDKEGLLLKRQISGENLTSFFRLMEKEAINELSRKRKIAEKNKKIYEQIKNYK